MKLFNRYLGLGILFISFGPVTAIADQVALINQTKQSLCFYTGNNLINCNLVPGSKVFMELPTHTIYHGKPVTNTTVTITDKGQVVEPSGANGSYTVRQNINLCQTRAQAQLQARPIWEIKPGFDSGCNIGLRYKGDRP